MVYKFLKRKIQTFFHPRNSILENKIGILRCLFIDNIKMQFNLKKQFEYLRLLIHYENQKEEFK